MVGACLAGLAGCQSESPNITVVRDLTSTTAEWQRPTQPISTDGPISTTIPESAVVVAPGESIQDAVDSAPEGATFWLEEGIHRLAVISPKNGQIFLGAPGAVLRGSIVLDDFTLDGEHWVHTGIDAEGEQRGQCSSDSSTCQLPEDLYFGAERLTRVASLRQVDADSWYLDYDTDTLYMGRDPAGEEVELAVVPSAFLRTAEEVTIEGLILERYASPAQVGVIVAGRAWTITNNEIRHNHGSGLSPGSDGLVADNYFHHNGQFAIDGGGEDTIYERNEIAYNHLGDYSYEWGAGAVKFVHTTNLVLRDNFVHNNHGPGLWIDGYNENTLFEGNRIMDNVDAGIKIEISGSAIVRDNEVSGNGYGNSHPPRGAGIMIRESGPVEVTGNRLWGNKEAIVLHQDDSRENPTDNRLHGIWVHGNQIDLGEGVIGYFGDIGRDAFVDADLRFEDNQYVGGAEGQLFLDHGRRVRFEQWQEAGRDAGSTLTSPESD